MSVKPYCDHCHYVALPDNAPISDKMASEWSRFISKFCSHANITGKTIAAHPITTALVSTAVIASIVAGSVLLGLALGIAIAAIGMVLIELGLVTLTISSQLFHYAREEMEHEVFKEGHKLNAMQPLLLPNQKVCLVVEATDDHNGAFNQQYYDKWEAKYPVIHVKVSSGKEIQDAIDQVSAIADIQVLVHAAHGSKKGYHLSRGHGITVGNVNQLGESYAKLAKDATIVFDSCLTGGTRKNNKANIAQVTSQYAPGRTIIAPTISINADALKFKGSDKLKVGIQQGFICRENVMRVYKDGVLQPTCKYVKV